MKTPFQLKKSTRKHKKYMAVFKNGKAVHFGDNRYEQFKDSTGLGVYSHLNHGNLERRKRYYSRHGTKTKLYSAKWFSHKFLW